MNHIARELGVDALAFKEMHIAKQGDLTSTAGRYHFPVPVKEMIEEVDEDWDEDEEIEEYVEEEEGVRQ